MGKSQTQAVSQNLRTLPGAEELAGKTNAFNVEQLQKILQQTIPGYTDITGKTSANIESLLKGEIPKDVQASIETAAAGTALEGGYGGTGMGRNLVARDLGLTSLSLIEKGMGAAESWIRNMGALTTPAMFDVSSMFVTPTQQFQATMENQQMRFGRDWLQNQLSSAYSPNNIIGASLIKTDEQLASIAASVAGSAAGKLI